MQKGWVPHWQASKRLGPMVCSSAMTRYCFLRGAGLLRLQEIERCRRSTGNGEYVDAGGLMSYSASIYDVWRRAGSVVNKLLKGSKASEIPIELPTKFELVINLKTAKALGLECHQLADEVIE